MDERSGPAEAEHPGAAKELVESETAPLVRPMGDFHDPSQEWRRLFSELFGTFLLVLVAAGGPMLGQVFPDMVGTAAAVAAPGLMVLAIIRLFPCFRGSRGRLHTCVPGLIASAGSRAREGVGWQVWAAMSGRSE